MQPFEFSVAHDLDAAVREGRETQQGQVGAPVQFLAGGTTLIDLMKLDVITPQHLVDIGPLSTAYAGIASDHTGLRLGAFAKMAEVAAHPAVLSGYPVIAQSLELAASPQIRNMATLGGNVLQRTRCPYYRDTSYACNKRKPGSGCTAISSQNRTHAVLGVDESCISQFPGDFAVALVALDAQIDLTGPHGARRIPFSTLHRKPEGRPHIETTLLPGEVITQFHIPAGGWTRRSSYLKVRDRASYEFALCSAAVALEMTGDTVRNVRIGLGGVAYRPWRSHEAEAVLMGKPLNEANAQAAARAAFAGAVTHAHNRFKPELGRRTVVRALMELKA